MAVSLPPVRVPAPVRVIAAVLMLLALGLCVWQVRRHGERNVGRGLALAVEALPPLRDGDLVGAASLWRMVEWRGRFDGVPDLIAGRMQGHDLGYGVVQCFVREDGRAVMVDRGWVLAASVAGTVARLTPGAPATLRGQLRPVDGSSTSLPVAGHGARIWPGRAWAALVNSLPVPVSQDHYVVEAVQADEKQDETLPKGSIVGVPARDDTSLHYASQWFAIAGVLAIVVVPSAMARARHFLGA